MSTINQKLDKMEKELFHLRSSLQEFTKKALLLQSVGTKDILSNEEAAVFLDLTPDYIYQLVHRGKITPIGGRRRGKSYFKKSDLKAYLLAKDKNKTEILPPEQWKK